MKTKMVLMSVAVVVLMIAGQVLAGSLEPSAAPGPTMKTLDEVEPRIPISQADIPKTINTSGSYYLTGDITAGGTAITVDADNVTIDLSGYSLIGPGSGTNYGVYMNGRNNVEIRNGTIRNFFTGIYEEDITGRNHRVIDIRAISNTQNGIYLECNNNMVKGCMVSDNGASASGFVKGIYVRIGSTVTGNTVCNNGNSASSYVHGIQASAYCTVTGNTLYNNGESAGGSVYAIQTSGYGSVTDNTACWNGYNAGNVYVISASQGSTVTGNTVVNNGASVAGSVIGISVSGYSLVGQNTAYSNGSGAGSATNITLGVVGCVYVDNVAP